MGYSYTLEGRLCCDSCGRGGTRHGRVTVRRRACPFKVHYADGSSLPNCPAAALCSECYAKHKATLHEHCKDQAAISTQRECEVKRRLEAGDLQIKSAWNTASARVTAKKRQPIPEGYVGVLFEGLHRQEYRLVQASDYHWSKKNWLSDYPDAQPWFDDILASELHRTFSP